MRSWRYCYIDTLMRVHAFSLKQTKSFINQIKSDRYACTLMSDGSCTSYTVTETTCKGYTMVQNWSLHLEMHILYHYNMQSQLKTLTLC